MNEIKKLNVLLKERIPNVATSLDAPALPDGFWCLDVNILKRYLVVEWSSKEGLFLFSVIEEDRGYGQGPDEVHSSLDAILERIVQLSENAAT